MTCVHYASIASSAIIEASHPRTHYYMYSYYHSWQQSQSHHLLQNWKIKHQTITSSFPYCHEHYPKLASSVTQHVILLAVTPETVFSHTLEVRFLGWEPFLLHGMCRTKMSSRPLVRSM